MCQYHGTGSARSECGGKGRGHSRPDTPIVTPPPFVGEFGLGNRPLLFDPNNRLLDAAEPCFEAIDAGVAH
jgi:hypothetical protein